MTMSAFLFGRAAILLAVWAGTAIGAAWAATPVAPAAPNAVVVTGTVPDETTRQAILQRAREVYGSDRVVDQLTIGQVVAPPNWSGYVQRLISPGLKQVSRGELSISGNTVDVKGEVGNEALRQQLVSDMSTQLNPTYTVRNGLRVASSDQGALDGVLANRIVEFESGSAALTPQGRAILDEMVKPLLGLPAGRKVEVIGHTDNLGGRDANVALSAARADAVKAYLVSRSVAAEMVETSGAGPDRPVVSNGTAEGRARNRRIEFRVSQ
jgi:OOP family OmpA-OmpF porin